MTESRNQWDPWAVPSALLWILFFFAGLDPERLFYAMRSLGGVVTQTAMVNNPHLVTLAFSGYIGLFVYLRCLEEGFSRVDAKARGLQFGILGLMAFLNFSLLQVLRLPDIPVANLRLVVTVVALAKVTTWFYLLITMLRYALLGHRQVFGKTTSLFPSTYSRHSQKQSLGESSSVVWIEAENKQGPAPHIPGSGDEPSEETGKGARQR